MCSFGSCKTRFEFLSQFRKVRKVRKSCKIAFAKNQTRLAYEDKRDLYCTSFNSYCVSKKHTHFIYNMAYIGHFGWADNVYYRTRPIYLMTNGCAKFDERSSNHSKVIALLWQRNENLWWWSWRRRQDIISSKSSFFNIIIDMDISIVSIFITTKQKTIEIAELDFSICFNSF